MRIPEDRAVGFYHCISRVVDRRFIFEEEEKEHFVALMRECEAFCEVRILTYCLMSNHFHILVEVEKRPENPLTADEILAKLEKLSGYQNVGAVRQKIEMFRNAKDSAGEEGYLDSFRVRMWDVSFFIKMIKQRFSHWYNRRAGRKGTLWEERFKSVLVDGAGDALVTMSAYIDLNPVRGGIVKDPKEYRWSGYGEAVAGRKGAKLGLQTVVTAMRKGKEESLSKALELYRMRIYNDGHEQNESLDENGRLVQGALSHEDVMKVLSAKGTLPVADYIRCKVRYFCDGAVFGTREYVEGIFDSYRERFGGKRKDGARKMRGLQGAELYTLRNLQVAVFQ